MESTPRTLGALALAASLVAAVVHVAGPLNGPLTGPLAASPAAAAGTAAAGTVGPGSTGPSTAGTVGSDTAAASPVGPSTAGSATAVGPSALTVLATAGTVGARTGTDTVRIAVSTRDTTGRPRVSSIATDPATAARLLADPGVDAELDGTARLLYTPTDPAFPGQWEHRLTGLESAWDTELGDPGVVIAVLDSGVAPHAEFGDRLLPGTSFIGGDPLVDPLGHGTAVASVAAAGNDNGLGGTGVCPRCSILPVQVADSSGSVPWSAAANAIVWATDQGADIVNLSFGSPSASTIIADAIAYARSRGVVVVAAAGNDGTDTPVYPAALDGVIGATGHAANFDRYSWSSYGPWVDVAAPGCVTALQFDTVVRVCGTSFASPWAAGLAGLVLSHNPVLTDVGVTNRLLASTSPVDYVAAGRLDATVVFEGGVAELALTTKAVPDRSVVVGGTYRGEVARVDLLVDGVTAASDPTPSGGRWQVTWDAGRAGIGNHVVTAAAVDPTGRAIPGQPVTVTVFEPTATGFGDVEPHAFYTEPVAWMVIEGITTGTSPTTFSPDAPVTRGQLATFLWRYAGRPAPTPTDTRAIDTRVTDTRATDTRAIDTRVTDTRFTDTRPDAFYATAVDWMVEHGITTGTSPTTFSPDAPVTRGQLATFLWRLARSGVR